MVASPAMTGHSPTVALIGFGEAATAFASGWVGERVGVSLKAYDIETKAVGKAAERKWDEYCKASVTGCETPEDAVDGADATFSLVTADQALVAAKSVTGGLREGAFYFDCNSCAPETKKQAALVIGSAGGRYVDVAVMAPVHPDLHRTPVFVSGDAADAALSLLERLSANVRRVPGEVGAASAIKLVRSVMMKGLETLMAECVLAGRTLGVEDIVLDTLEKTYPGFGWKRRAGRMFERMMIHGRRRAAEMSEAAAMVEHLGLPGRMARAAAAWQRQIGELRLDVDDNNNGYGDRADAVLDALMADVRREAASAE